MRLRASVLVLLLATAAALTACTAAAPASTTVPSPSPSAVRTKPTEIASPIPVAATPAVIVIGPEGFEVQDAAGTVLLEKTYGDPLDEVVAELGTTLGAAPVVGQSEGHIERAPHQTLSWDGLQLNVRGDELPHFELDATGPATGGVGIRTPEGVAIGADASILAATYPSTLQSYPEVDIAWGPAVVVDASTAIDRTFSVGVFAEAPATTITRIFAPTDNLAP